MAKYLKQKVLPNQAVSCSTLSLGELAAKASTLFEEEQGKTLPKATIYTTVTSLHVNTSTNKCKQRIRPQ